MAREQLATHYTKYARIVAASYYAKRFHDEIEFGDYFQLACVGLLEAVDRFDPAQGVQFKTFASRRMHGSILNGLERATEKQQQIAARQRLIGQRVQAAKAMALARQAQGAGGQAEDTKPAARAPDQLLSYVADVGLGLALSWMLEGSGLLDPGGRSESIPFYRSVELRQLRERLLELVNQLPAQERSVIRGHYLQELAFEEIASSHGLSPGRISQVHSQALLRLRNTIHQPRGIDVAW